MTDGLYIDLTATRTSGAAPTERLQLPPSEPASPTLDLSTFDSWIELQPIEVSIDLLYRIAADLSETKGWPGVAYDVRCAADGLKTLTRHVAR